MTRLEPEQAMRNFLRFHLTDHNVANRAGKQYVFDDWPRSNLDPSSFPRVVVTKIGESGPLIGIGDDDTWDDVTFQIDVLIHRKTGVIDISHVAESVGVISNDPTLSLDFLPSTVTSIEHDATGFGTVTLVVNDSDFTSPASLSAGTVEVSRSSGNLNFSSADLVSFAGETITSTYTESIEGEIAAKRISRDVIVAIRNNWRQDARLDELKIPEKIGGPTIAEFDRERGWHRAFVEYKFKRFNSGEEV